MIHRSALKHLLAGLLLAGTSLAASAQAPAAAPLFAATLIDSDGRPVAVASYRGRPLVINFWARWCPPCVKEIPELSAFQKKYGKQITVLGIGLEDDPAAVREFMQRHDMAYPVLLAGERGTSLLRELGNTRGGLPYTVFIAADGRIVGQKLGLLRSSDLETAASLLRQH